ESGGEAGRGQLAQGNDAFVGQHVSETARTARPTGPGPRQPRYKKGLGRNGSLLGSSRLSCGLEYPLDKKHPSGDFLKSLWNIDDAFSEGQGYRGTRQEHRSKPVVPLPFRGWGARKDRQGSQGSDGLAFHWCFG